MKRPFRVAHKEGALSTFVRTPRTPRLRDGKMTMTHLDFSVQHFRIAPQLIRDTNCLNQNRTTEMCETDWNGKINVLAHGITVSSLTKSMMTSSTVHLEMNFKAVLVLTTATLRCGEHRCVHLALAWCSTAFSPFSDQVLLRLGFSLCN